MDRRNQNTIYDSLPDEVCDDVLGRPRRPAVKIRVHMFRRQCARETNRLMGGG